MDADSIQLTQDKQRREALVNTAMKLRIRINEEQLLKQEVLHVAGKGQERELVATFYYGPRVYMQYNIQMKCATVAQLGKNLHPVRTARSFTVSLQHNTKHSKAVITYLLRF